jgi:hypothetical protein
MVLSNPGSQLDRMRTRDRMPVDAATLHGLDILPAAMGRDQPCSVPSAVLDPVPDERAFVSGSSGGAILRRTHRSLAADAIEQTWTAQTWTPRSAPWMRTGTCLQGDLRLRAASRECGGRDGFGTTCGRLV